MKKNSRSLLMKPYFFFMCLLIAACTPAEKKAAPLPAPRHQPNPLSVGLTKKATEMMTKARSQPAASKKYYDSALILLNLATRIDSLDLVAFSQQVQLMRETKRPVQALAIVRKMRAINPDGGEIIMGEGFLLEKMGKRGDADKCYHEALQAYERRLQQNPENRVAMGQIAFAYIFVRDSSRAIAEINRLIAKYPGDQRLINDRATIKTFDRRKFIAAF